MRNRKSKVRNNIYQHKGDAIDKVSQWCIKINREKQLEEALLNAEKLKQVAEITKTQESTIVEQKTNIEKFMEELEKLKKIKL